MKKILLVWLLVFGSTFAYAWEKLEGTSPIDDSKKVILYVQTADPVRADYGNSRDIILSLQCVENKTNVALTFGGAFMSSLQGAGLVTFRFDSEDAFSLDLTESTDNKALMIDTGKKSINFIKKMLGHSKLVIRAMTYSGDFVVATFDITGLDVSLPTLREACNW